MPMSSLKGHFLIATPGMVDERFSESVVYLVGHSEDGAMGLMVNHTLPDLSAGDIFGELELGPPEELIRVPERVRDRAVLMGGPVRDRARLRPAQPRLFPRRQFLRGQ